MDYSIQVQVDGDLVGVAQVMRVLKRHAVSAAQVVMQPLANLDVTSVCAPLARSSRADELAAALVRIPAVIDAVIMQESSVVARFSRRRPERSPR